MSDLNDMVGINKEVIPRDRDNAEEPDDIIDEPLQTLEMGQALRNIITNPRVDYLKKYMNIIGIHKITDMKHDHLGVNNTRDTFPHFKELLPKVCNVTPNFHNENILAETNINYSRINDDYFLKKHLKLMNDGTEIPIDGLNSLVTQIGSLTDTTRLQLEIHYNTSIIGADPIYTFSNIHKIKYDNDPIAKDFLDILQINSGSIFNVDFQYKLWDILKNGASNTETIIYLKKTSENENDPAGKYNILDTTFRPKKKSGISTQFAIHLEQIPSIYKSFDDRFAKWEGGNLDTTLDSIIDTESPDFFSRFEVTTGPLVPLKTCFGYFDRFSSPITISDNYVGFTYTSDAKQDNSNANVRAKIDKLYKDKKSGYLIALACEAAKKASGDDLQILSQRKTKQQLFKILDPEDIDISRSGGDAYSILKNETSSIKQLIDNKEYFVSHDGPTCVRNLIEGCNLLLMHVSGWAIKFERGPPIVIPIETKINNLLNALSKPIIKSDIGTSAINIQEVNSVEINNDIPIIRYPYINHCLEISTNYNKIIKLFYAYIIENINKYKQLYKNEISKTDRSSVANSFKHCKQYLFYLLCFCNIKQYFLYLPDSPILSQSEYDIVNNNQLNITDFGTIDTEILYSKLQKIYQLQQLQLEMYKYLTNYINPDLTINTKKLEKIVLISSEGKMNENWNIFIDPASKPDKKDPLTYPLNLIFIDKFSEYLLNIDDMQVQYGIDFNVCSKNDVIELFSTHSLESKFINYKIKFPQINSASFHANILCKLNIADTGLDKSVVVKDLTEIAVMTDESDKYDLHEQPNTFTEPNIDDIVINAKKWTDNEIRGGARVSLRSADRIYKYGGLNSQPVIPISDTTKFNFYTDLFSNLYNTLFYDLTQILVESNFDYDRFIQQTNYYLTIIDTSKSAWDRFVLAFNLDQVKDVFVSNIVKKITTEYLNNSDAWPQDAEYPTPITELNAESGVMNTESDETIHKPDILNTRTMMSDKILFILIVLLFIITSSNITRLVGGGVSKTIEDKPIEKISPLKDSHLLINNMFDTMQNKMIDNSYLKYFIIHMILNKQMTDVFELCHKAMHTHLKMNIFTPLFKDKTIPQGFSDSIHQIQSNFMKTINICLSNILFILPTEETGCELIREDAFELTEGEVNLSSFHFINRQSLYLILGSITIPESERESRYKNAKAAFNSIYWKFFYQMMGGKEYITQLFGIFNAIGSEEHYKMIDFLSKLKMNEEFTIEYIQATLEKSHSIDESNRQSLYDKYNEFCGNFHKYSISIFSPIIKHRRFTHKFHSARLYKDVNKKILRTQSAPSVFPKTSFSLKKKSLLPLKINTTSPENLKKASPRSISPTKSNDIEVATQTPKPKLRIRASISPTKSNEDQVKSPTRSKNKIGYKNISENDEEPNDLKRKNTMFDIKNTLKRWIDSKYIGKSKRTRKTNLIE